MVLCFSSLNRIRHFEKGEMHLEKYQIIEKQGKKT